MADLLTALVFVLWAISDVWCIKRLRRAKEEPSPFLYLEIVPLLLIAIHYLGNGQPLIMLLPNLVTVGVFRILINLDGRIDTLAWGCIRWIRSKH